MSELRIALLSRRVHPAHGPGGLERAVHDQAVHLDGAGVRVDLITETPDAERRLAAETAVGPRTRIHWVAPGWLPIGQRAGTVILDRISNYPAWSIRAADAIDGDVDVVHAHGLAGLGVARRRAAGTLGRPFVLGTHGMEEFLVPSRLKYMAYAPFRHWLREAAGSADRVVVTDNALRSLVAEELRVAEDRLVTIPNAIDPAAGVVAADVERARALLGPAAETPLLLVSVGRIASNKGFDVLARALGRARNDLPAGWRWVLVGDGPYRSEVQRAVQEAGVDDSVLLVGAVDDAVKHGLLELADWFVHPTLYEGSSLATLEAMGHRLPVLGSRAGGLPDKVCDGVTGFLVTPGDESELAAALVRAAAAPATRFGAAGRSLLDERFTWKASTRRLIELYRELASASAASC